MGYKYFHPLPNSGFSSCSDCPVVGCLNLYLKTPDPLKKKSVNSDHQVQRKCPIRGPISTILLLSKKDVNFTTFWLFFSALGDQIDLILF